MRYLLLIHVDETAEPPEGMTAHLEAYYRLDDDLRAVGAFVDGLPLHPSAAGATVRVRAGKASVTDGPYAETKEQCGGYYLVDVPDRDAALTWAAKIPGAALGTVEVREVLELPATFAEFQDAARSV